MHALDHDVQDGAVNVEFSRDITPDVTCYGSVTHDVTCLDVFYDDVSLDEALGLDVI